MPSCTAAWFFSRNAAQTFLSLSGSVGFRPSLARSSIRGFDALVKSVAGVVVGLDALVEWVGGFELVAAHAGREQREHRQRQGELACVLHRSPSSFCKPAYRCGPAPERGERQEAVQHSCRAPYGNLRP